jgi:predicted XRE-type DNA-binding protein
MTAVLVSLPTARPAIADDHEDRTQLFRPNQKRPTWKDVVRARAPATPPAARQVPAIRLVPVPDTRVSLERAPFVPPYLRKGYRWDLLGSELHAHLRNEAGKSAAIRSCPPSLGKLLATPEWKGATVTQPEPEDFDRMRELCKASIREAEGMRVKAKCAAQKRAMDALIEARTLRLARVSETVRVTRPSGAFILWLAQN